jgi:CheY-like chemotaxis protein
MSDSEFQPPALPVYELQEIWRKRLEESQKRYQTAANEYRGLIERESEGGPPESESPLVRARREKAAALMEYSRVLGVFTDLTIYGKLPDGAVEQPVQEARRLIVVVDDDESIRDSIRTLLRSVGYQVATFASAQLFLDADEVNETACIVLDVSMPVMNGLELQRHLNAIGSNVPIILVTAFDDSNLRRQAMNDGAVEYLCKPFDAKIFISTVEAALARQSVQQLYLPRCPVDVHQGK